MNMNMNYSYLSASPSHLCGGVREGEQLPTSSSPLVVRLSREGNLLTLRGRFLSLSLSLPIRRDRRGGVQEGDLLGRELYRQPLPLAHLDE
jgi:hypothetical protein